MQSQRIHGEVALQLPAADCETVWLTMSADERLVYDVHACFEGSLREGGAIESMIKMRRGACAHVYKVHAGSTARALDQWSEWAGEWSGEGVSLPRRVGSGHGYPWVRRRQRPQPGEAATEGKVPRCGRCLHAAAHASGGAPRPLPTRLTWQGRLLPHVG